MDKYQGIFDQGFSGILDDVKSSIPDYIDKLAEQEIDFNPKHLETPSIAFDKDSGITRASELTSDEVRNFFENRFSKEKEERTQSINLAKKIEKHVSSMIYNGKTFDEIHSSLSSKFSKESVSKYLESKVALLLNNFAFLGFNMIQEKKATLADQFCVENKLKRSEAHDILQKFSKLEYISEPVIKEYKQQLASSKPLTIISKFLFSLDEIKENYYKNKEAHTHFQRDIDEKDLNVRDVTNNVINTVIEAHQVEASMLTFFKDGVNSKLSRSQNMKRMTSKFGYQKTGEFLEKYKKQVEKLEKFAKRQMFDTDFSNTNLQGHEIQPEEKEAQIDKNAMMSHCYHLMTNGNNLSYVQESLQKTFGVEATSQFLQENKKNLDSCNGQLGYTYIDSNIYKSCNEMSDNFSKLQHIGSDLVSYIKRNSKCETCSLLKNSICGKTGLKVSDDPTVRSSRVAKKIFEKASSFISKSHIDSFVEKLQSDGNNASVVSAFNLSLKISLSEQHKNFNKRASKSQTFDTDFGSTKQQGYEILPKAKEIKIDKIAMLNYSYNLLTRSNDLNSVEDLLKKTFGIEETSIFMKDHRASLNSCYGQLGYTYIDSNIYKSCSEMSDDFSKLQHIGSSLISCVKQNSKCKGCTLLNEGICGKTGLKVSEDPVVRSSRVAKKIFNKALTFVSKAYIDSFTTKLQSDSNNMSVVSEFNLGLQSALGDEQKNIGERASKDRSESDAQASFIQPISYNVELFNETSESDIIDKILKEENQNA